MRPAQILALLLAASLGGCGGYTMFDPDTTASFSSSARQADWQRSLAQNPSTADPDATVYTSPPAAADKSALNSLIERAADGKLNADPAPTPPASVMAATLPPAPGLKQLALATPGDAAVPTAPPAADKPIVEPRGHVYLYRGVAGLIYSRGIDGLAERIRRAGLKARVSTYLLWREDVDQAIRDYRRDGAPITIVGHSMGGDAALGFAERLNQENIPVSLLVTYDPTRIADDVPPNVERYINIFQSSNVMGGGNVVQSARFHGHYASYNLKDHSEIVHINIEKAEHIQEQLVSKIVSLSSTPANAEGEGVPLHLEVPAEASIELWDSGLPVSAHAGDTLKSIAANYHVPLWSLTQANLAAGRGTLNEGQRIIVPRRLLPIATPSVISSYTAPSR
jgi:hypothetical protein